MEAGRDLTRHPRLGLDVEFEQRTHAGHHATSRLAAKRFSARWLSNGSERPTISGRLQRELAVTRSIVRLLGCAALILAGSRAAIAAGSPPLLRDGSRDMNFALGTWRTDITSFEDPFGHPDR